MKELFLNVKENTELTKGVIRMKFHSPYLPEFTPGQFINISVGRFDGVLLRRPISVYKHDAAAKTLECVFEIKGKGTTFLSRLKGGDLPATVFLGNGFDKIPETAKKIALVGGGLGCPPLYSVIQKYKYKGVKFYTYLGFGTKSKVICEDDFAKVSEKTVVATDDGSYGEADFITNAFKRDVFNIAPDMILSCGPAPMFKALKALDLKIPTYISTEARMGCGIGACYVCACLTTNGNRRVCADGPVFDIKEVIL
ncbi:MAG: dihydroorotate dehydrogenase electron transfer subunit [Clostridiales bacterium]|jgi:dihydroorotate dehydrogenase electron transfer subunit|nr:dihydroorotate dehydrogenase electron transfer subunit [Clostridiales bacterium]